MKSAVAIRSFEPIFKQIVRAALPIGFAIGCGTTEVGRLEDPHADAEVGRDAIVVVDGQTPFDAEAPFDARPPIDAMSPRDAEPQDFGNGCGSIYEVVGLDGGAFPDSSDLVMFCEEACNGAPFCRPVTDTNGEEAVGCVRECTGRRPEGLASARFPGASVLGRMFAEMAHLEAASIPAFTILGKELEAHRAPKRLVDRAAIARRDEIRHARIVGRAARALGAVVPRARVGIGAVRALEAVAVENAVEGCVRESYGALLGAWQAHAAREPRIRRMMARIARDESTHGDLAWRVHAWTMDQLPRRARENVRSRLAGALDEIERAPGTSPSDLERTLAGVPSPEVEHALFTAFRREISARI